eukprot:TRINITY_DN10447_c0_g1_i2.p1 TRINITY_DN10447_c0_g1~~TRINITY_DN10447_c0_g1_i2.p1  ORF type:complete len:137 (+),score=21.78 TRINITY_DN10447_c0_g1_i2:168-578(+)
MSEVAVAKLELLGFRVGQKLVEKYTTDRPRFNEKIDIIKFICREFWQLLFQKQVDSLRTNRKGVFVLTDNKFRWITRLSSDTSHRTKQLVEKYVVFPCGLIKGALDVLGVPCFVKAEISSVPMCTFTITLPTEPSS